ncbi:MAG: aspartate carbamoyltransferase [Sarcina sp.]
MINSKRNIIKLTKCSNPKCITNHEDYVRPSFKPMGNKTNSCLCEFCSSENIIGKNIK